MPDLLERLKSALGDRYAVESEIGRGGMATVFLAEDLKHHRQVAIKVLHPELAATLGTDRFLREIEIAAKLEHPHILALIDSGEADGLPYYVMPYVEGESLRERLEREGQLAIDQALRIAAEVADGLAYAHEHSLVHRDIKPGNILLSAGHARIGDFGVARAISEAGGEKVTATGMAVGTPAYMSPEQASGEEVDERSDLYALGCVLYEMLAGEPPLTGATPQSTAAKRLTDRPTPLGAMRRTVPGSLDSLVERMLATSAADRPATARPLAEELAKVRQGPEPAARKSPAARWLAPVIGLAAIAVVAAVVWMLATDRSMTRQVRLLPAGADDTGAYSIAVLPFADMSPDKDQEYFSDGISEELLNLLAKIPELRVTARTSSFSFKGQSLEIPEIAERLNVAHILDGSVRKSGNEVRITAQLIRADEGYQLWSKTWDRTLEDIFAIQDEIASDVAEQLKVTLLGVAPTVEETDPEAYALFLQARQLHRQFTTENLEQSNALLQQALAIDPEYAAAWAELARNYSLQAGFGLLPFDEGYPLAREAANRALAIDPEYAEAYVRLGMIANFYDGDLAAVQKESHAMSRLTGLSMVYHALGQVAESDAALAELIERDEQGAAYDIAYVLAFRGEADRSFEWLDRAVQYNDPGLAGIAVNIHFANIHDDPRWLPFLESIGRSPEQLAAIEFEVTLPQ